MTFDHQDLFAPAPSDTASGTLEQHPLLSISDDDLYWDPSPEAMKQIPRRRTVGQPFAVRRRVARLYAPIGAWDFGARFAQRSANYSANNVASTDGAQWNVCIASPVDEAECLCDQLCDAAADGYSGNVRIIAHGLNCKAWPHHQVAKGENIAEIAAAFKKHSIGLLVVTCCPTDAFRQPFTSGYRDLARQADCAILLIDFHDGEEVIVDAGTLDLERTHYAIGEVA